MTSPEQYRSSALVRLAIMAGLFILLVTANAAQAQTFQVLHTFTGGSDGAFPVGGLTMDRTGNLYGATMSGGYAGSDCESNGCGTVFKLVRGSSGWVLYPLYAFDGVTDGISPSARVIFGPDGALYGVTQAGGGGGCSFGFGPDCGTVFRVAPPATACKSFICPWQKSTLWAFNITDGDTPLSEVVFDRAGNLYGTTFAGGSYPNDCLYDGGGCGTVYELTPSNGKWTETVLHSFPASTNDGQNPWTPNLIFDSAGNLYGSTLLGGSYGEGTVFQLSPSGSGWTENLLYSFQGESDGSVPEGGLLLASGNLIGTTSNGGAGNGGTVFELTPSQGNWVFNLIYSLTGPVSYGPTASLTMDASGNLYGTTVGGGAYDGGSAFKLTPSTGGWTYTSLHDFTGGSDGSNIQSNLIMDAHGNLYGVASNGGKGSCSHGAGCGVVFEITP